MSVDIEKLAAILRDAARVEIMPRFRRLDAGDIRQKSEAIDLVTEADEAAERMIAREVRALAPAALFVGEESVAADPKLLDALTGADFAIVVDPVDGTANFAAGVPLFGVMAAVVRRGETVAGIVYDPMGDDWVLAERGGGTWQKFPDGRAQRLRSAAAVPLAEMVGLASTGYLPRDIRARIMGNLAAVRMVASYRCAAHEYRIAAAGHVHFLMYNKLMPWDHLAGVLIMQEAGAHAALFDGSPYMAQHRGGGILVAPDADSWRQLRAEVFTV